MAAHQATPCCAQTRLPLRPHQHQRQTLQKMMAASALHPDGTRSIYSGELDLSLRRQNTLVQGAADTLYHHLDSI